MITTRLSARSADLARADEHSFGHLDVAEVAADSDVLAHRAPDERNLAPERLRGVDDLLHAVDVRREARHDDAPAAAREDLLQVRADDRLRGREARPVHVRRVAAQQQHALAPEFREPRDVGGSPVHGRLVELVVAGDQDRAEVGTERDRGRVGDRVRHVHELQRERSELDRFPRFGLDHLDVAQAVLVELRACHRGRQRACVDRCVELAAELAQHPRQRAEVVLVAVRDDDRLDVGGALAQIAEVGQHEVDADHLGGREAQPDVDHDDPAVVLDDRHVLADLAEAAERQHAQRHAPAPPRRAVVGAEMRVTRVRRPAGRGVRASAGSSPSPPAWRGRAAAAALRLPGRAG